MRCALFILVSLALACTSAPRRATVQPPPSVAPEGRDSVPRERTVAASPSPAARRVPSPAQPASGPDGPARGPRPYAQVVTAQARSDSGLILLHRIDERLLYEIPDSLLGRDLLLVTRIARTADYIGYGGESSHESVVRWERRGNRLLLRQAQYRNRAADTLPVALAVQNSNFEPVIQAFDIAAFNRDSSAMVVDVSAMFTRDVPMLGLDPQARQAFQVRRLDDTRSMLTSARSFPRNVEVRNILTYDAASPPSARATGTISLEMAHSMVLLPKEPMRPRLGDRRVGLMTVPFLDYGAGGQRVERRELVTRWRLEPKDTAAFQRGELVDPVTPIVFYIDAATPEEYRAPLIEGVNAWARVFERAGFRNAISARMAPTPQDDPEFSPEDARYSVIRYFASPIENAYGPRVVDPRSGEIIEADIGWYHNVTNLFAELYRLQVGAVDERALQWELPADVMHGIVRYVAAHEVGHTLGLHHAHSSNAGVPVDSLRSPTYMRRMGTTTPSVMDYARFNYVAQPGDGVDVLGPWFGPYDDYIIEWGYRPLPSARNPQDERATLDAWIRAKADDPTYRWSAHVDAVSGLDPLALNEQLGDDATKASRYGLANLKRIVPRMLEWNRAPGADYSRLARAQDAAIGQWHFYIGHVVALVGGRIETRRASDQPGVQWHFVPRERQRAAMRLLDEEVWHAPTWLLTPDRFDRLTHSGRLESLRVRQRSTLNALLDAGRLQRLLEAESQLGRRTYTMAELFRDLRHDIWRELSGAQAISMDRRMLQRGHLDRLRFLMEHEQPPAPPLPFPGPPPMEWTPPPRTTVNVVQSDIRPVVRAELEALRPLVRAAAARTTDEATRQHLRDADARIRDILEPPR